MLSICATSCGGSKRTAESDHRGSSAVGVAISGGVQAAVPLADPGSGQNGAKAVAPCPLDVFTQTLWAPTLRSVCLNCHLSDGLAQKYGSRFILLDPSQPNYLPANLAAFQAAAKTLVNNVPLILAKPSQQTAHVGGQIFTVDSSQYQAFAHFLSRTDMTGSCASVAPATMSHLALRSDSDVVRKAALLLAGRLPNATELSLTAGGDVNAALDSILAAPNFASFIKSAYNDALLLKMDNAIDVVYRAYNLASHASWRPDVNTLSGSVHGQWPKYANATELIAYVITHDKPYTEILTANYMMMNPYSACDFLGPGHTLAFSNKCSIDPAIQVNACNSNAFSFGVFPTGGFVDDCWEFLPAAAPWPNGPPVVGILSDLTFLYDWNTTQSNLNRHRANWIYTNLLGVDINSLGAVLPQGSSAQSSAGTAPTMDEPACAACHYILDPVASAMQNFGVNAAYGVRFGTPGSASTWPTTMFGPGFAGKVMPAATAGDPLAWLAHEIIADPRFARTAVRFWYTALTGNQALPDPAGTDASLAAKLAQNDFFDQIAQQFSADGYNTRHMIKKILLSPYFASAGYTQGTSASDQQLLAGFDHAHRYGPEQMHQIINAVTGSYWRLPGSPGYGTAYTVSQEETYTYLLNTSQFKVSDGGIWPGNTNVRNNDMTSVAAAIANFAAAAMPCTVVPADFALVPASRRLFAGVELSTTPDTETGKAAILQNLVTLRQLFLGQTLAVNDPEIQAAYSLFLSLYKLRQAAGDQTLAQTCQSGSVTSDPYYTLHAWMGVTDYLMNDFDFLYQ